jgi:predicted nuclease of predicted toxin-antitoxin system
MLFYADENFPLDVVAELRRLGHDVLTAFDDGRANQKVSDEKVLERATELGRTVLTINRIDFKRLHKTTENHSGIVICTFDADFVGQAQRIDAACKDLMEINNQLVRVYRPS